MQQTPPTLSLYINGTAVDGASTLIAPICNPGTGATAKNVLLTSTSDVATAVAADHTAHPRRCDSSQAHRQTVMLKFRRLVNERRSELAEILTAEHGRVTSDVRGEAARGIEAAKPAAPPVMSRSRRASQRQRRLAFRASATPRPRSCGSRTRPESASAPSTFYFDSKLVAFEAIVEDLNRPVRRSLSEAATRGCTRIGAQRPGFQGFYDFTGEIEVDPTSAVASTRSADIRSDNNTDTGEGLP